MKITKALLEDLVKSPDPLIAALASEFLLCKEKTSELESKFDYIEHEHPSIKISELLVGYRRYWRTEKELDRFRN